MGNLETFNPATGANMGWCCTIVQIKHTCGVKIEHTCGVKIKHTCGVQIQHT